MKHIAALSFVLLMTTGVCSQEKSPANIKPYMDRITPAGLSSTLHFLASDNFEGRRAGTAYERLAAEYLVSVISQHLYETLAPNRLIKGLKTSSILYVNLFNNKFDTI